jgi:hypothetical protein
MHHAVKKTHKHGMFERGPDLSQYWLFLGECPVGMSFIGRDQDVVPVDLRRPVILLQGRMW